MTSPDPNLPVVEVPSGLTAEQAALVTFAAAQGFLSAQETLRNQLGAALGALWAGFARVPNFDPPTARKFVSAVLPTALGAQRAMSALTVANLNRELRPPTPITVPPELVTGAALRGKDPTEYYQRPFREIKWRLSQGKPLDRALDAGLRRAESLVQTDLELAHTRTAQAYLGVAADELARRAQRWAEQPPEIRRQTPRPTMGEAGTIVGYRRVLSNRPNHCALCVLASTQRYRRGELMPIHPGCGCTVRPIFSTDEHADERVVDPDLLSQIHDVVERDLGRKYVDAGGRGPIEYRDIVIVHEHGELGPVMGVRGQHFQRDPSKPSHIGHRRVNPKPQEEQLPDLDALG